MTTKNKKAPAAGQPQDEPQELILPSSIKSLIHQLQQHGKETRVVLYRREMKPSPGKPRSKFLEEYENEAPSLKEIAIAYGGGAYEIQIFEIEDGQDEAQFFKSMKFNIDESYNQPARQQANALIAAPAITPQDQFNQSISMVSQLVSAITPLFTQRQQDANPSQMIASMAALGENMISTTFKNNLENQRVIMDTIRDVQANQAPAGEDAEDKTFDRIMQALELFIPIFLHSPQSMKTQLVQQAQETPDVKAVISNKVKTLALKKRLVEKFGDTQAEQIFEIFTKKPGNGKVTPKAEKKHLETAATK